ncbi:GxxExxY protein [Flavobacterium chryseum]|uniref:GxxExxY protein n=1 Tax=Flavobacterium sp. P3160 TaxID=2512113 RepID=UPI00105D7170|nr:GxxExxY protein [Flavobacterium sp. P3160]TDO69854.1 GxxExxY protein [Flavobacterium sp. P3160]
MITQKYLDELTYEVLGASIEVHKIIGKGLLENVYHQCLKEELSQRKLNFFTEMKVPILYKEKELIADFRCDLFVENCLVVELKTVSEINSIHQAQLLTYMKLLKAPKGIIINFNCFNIFKEGQKTFVNDISNYCQNIRVAAMFNLQVNFNLLFN